MAGEHAGHRQRMRERFQKHGLEGFAPHEVLELILFYAIPQRNVNPLAHRLIGHFRSLHRVLDASVEELQQVEGVGEYAATLLSLFSHTGRAMERSRYSSATRLGSYDQIADHCLGLLSGLDHEEFYVVCLNAQNDLIHDERIASGTVNSVNASPRLVLDALVKHKAAAVVLCHNHPSGSLVPSAQDMVLTRKLADLLTGIGMPLHDHVIVSRGHKLSMVACDLLKTAVTLSGIINSVADPAEEERIRKALEKKFGCMGEKKA